jgi:hypothetical protein
MKGIIKRILSAALALAMLAPAPVRAVDYQGSDSYRTGKYYRALQEVTLTGDPRTDIVNIALSQVGYQESAYMAELSGEIVGNANFTEYGGWYNMQDQWCAMFVSWCAALAGISSKVVPKHAYTPNGLYWMKDQWGRAYSRAKVEAGAYTPQPGDIIYFKSPSTKATTNHVGIVTGYRDGIVYTVEGNTSSPAIFSGGGTVARKSYPITNSYIVYICCPDYEGTGQKVKNGIASRSLAEKETSVQQALNLLESGDTGAYDRLGCDADGIVTLGSGQWYGNQAKSLVAQIRDADPTAFAALDTADLGATLNQDWTQYSLNQAQKDCLRGILGSEAGIGVQQKLMRQRLADGQALAETLGVTEAEAKLACGALYCLGGTVAVRRAVATSGADLSSKAICGAMDTMGYAGSVILDALN